MGKVGAMHKYLGCTLAILLAILPVDITAQVEKHTTKHKRNPPVKLLVDGNVQLLVKAFPCRFVAKAGADFYVWSVPESFKYESNENVITVTSAPNGTYKISVTGVTTNFLVDKDGKVIVENGKVKKEVIKDLEEIEIAIGTLAPPTPPGPNPPTPPSPTDLPIKGDGFRMLILEESASRTKLPASQLLFLTSKTVRDYLRSKCANDPSAGDGKAYRIIDPNMDLSTQPQFWKDAHKRAIDKAAGKYPWIALANGKEGYEGPLPTTLEECVNLIKRFGG